MLSRLVSITRVPSVYQLAQDLLTDRQLSERVILEGLAYEPGLRVLDLGCGPGSFADLFADDDYVGIDISIAYIDRAREKHPNKQFRVIDASSAGSFGGQFDRLLVCGVLHHMSDADVIASLDMARNVLSPSGFGFIAEAMWPENRLDVVGWALRRLDRGGNVRRYSEWLRLLQPFGVRGPDTYYNKLLPCMTCRLDFGNP